MNLIQNIAEESINNNGVFTIGLSGINIFSSFSSAELFFQLIKVDPLVVF